jgi:aminotransferase
MEHFLNQTVKNLPPSGIRRFFDLVVSAGSEVISLGVGEPDFKTPWHVRESAIYALEKGFTSYTENRGLLELRSEIAKKMETDFNLKYNAESEILVTNGVSEGMDLAIRATINPGDIVLLPDPGYVMYEPLLNLQGGVASKYDPLNLASLDHQNLSSAKGILLNYPGNPLGNTFTKKELIRLAELIERYDLLVYSDEIYRLLTYNAEHLPFACLESMKERVIMLDGLSKSHAMTGMRLGWVLGPAVIIEAMNKIHQYSALCASSLAQTAAIEALRRGDKEAKAMFQAFLKRRDLCAGLLTDLGLKFVQPQGAFYLFVDIRDYYLDDVEFCEQLLKQEQLAVVPGSAFGSKGKGFVRLTFAENSETLKKALERLSSFLQKIKK